MQRCSIVPHHHVPLPPGVRIARARSGGGRCEFGDELLRRAVFHAVDGVGMGGNVERTRTIRGICPDHAPALRRQCRALVGADDIGCNLGARIGIIMPGEQACHALLRRFIQPAESEPGRDIFGFAAMRRNDARGKDGCECRHALERGVGVPKLVRLIAQCDARIRRHDSTIRPDRREDHEMRTRALRRRRRNFERAKAA